MSRDPRFIIKAVLGLVVAVVVLLLPFQYSPATNQVFSQVLYIGLAAMGLNLLTGYNGQISIGHGAFFGVGAFTTAILVVDYGWYLEATLPVAALTSAALGVFIGVPALRVKGIYLGLVTLGLSVLFPTVVKKFVEGPGNIPLLQPKRDQVSSLFPDVLADDQYQYFFCLFVVVLLFLMAARLIHSRAGRSMIAVRDQELAASTVGIDVAKVKVTSFALSAAYAGVAGSLSVMVDRVADATNPLIYFQDSIEFLVAVVIGGAATLSGPLVGAALLKAIERRFEGTEAMAPALLGGALILVVFVLPNGVVGAARQLVNRFLPPGGGDPDPDPGGSDAPVAPSAAGGTVQ